MAELGYITEQEKEAALNEKVVFETVKTAIVAPHFVQYVETYLAEKYGEQSLQEGGYRVYTTLDPRLQEIAERAVREGVERNISANGYNGSLVAMDPKTGQILAMVGSKDYFGKSQPEGCITGRTCLFEPNVNVATSLQQPGSSFKPYAYVTAFNRDHKYAPASMLMDVVTNFGNYTPRNFNLSENGPVSMRKALAGSLNIPAVKTIALVGEENVINTARDLGIEAPFKDCGLSLVLGGCDVKLIDHTAAYGVLANEGKRVKKTGILKVVSKTGEVLEEYKEESTQVLDPQAVYQVVNIMSDNNARAWVFGTNSPLQLGNRPVAAKTGTTQEFRDGWTLGFTPSLVAGVWVGNNNNAPMRRDAVVTAAPIWNQFMREALAGTPIEQFNRPDGIRNITVDAVSGLLPTQYTPQTVSEIFADYNAPTQYDNVHVPVEVDSLTGLPATDSTPPERRVVEVYKVFHSERPNVPSWEDPVIAWALKNGYKYPPGSGITNPEPSDNTKVQFITPTNNQLITSLPFTVSLNVDGEISKVDLLLNGNVVKTINPDSSSFQTTINKTMPDGTYTLAAKVTFTDGSSTTNSVRVRYSINGGILMISPESGDVISDGWQLEAISSENFNSVSFYFTSGNSESGTLIGQAQKISSPNGYRYLLEWNDLPSSGNYRVFAKSSNGTVSTKVPITIN
jgi:membrane carboxypeptidase/penicillin-binding protein PbpC